MKTSEILGKDYYDGNEKIFQKALRKIKPFKNISMDENISMELLEKLVSRYEHKYAIMINYITPVYLPKERTMYSVDFRGTEGGSRLSMYPHIFASTIYELFVKISLFYYMEISVKNKIPLKDWSKSKV